MSEEAIMGFLRKLWVAGLTGVGLGLVVAAATLIGCHGSAGDDDWDRRCVAAGEHEFYQSTYKGHISLCLTADGRILEIPSYVE